MTSKILVIDDEEAVCEILQFNLEKAGYAVDCAYSAEEALELENLQEYSLFLVDIMMGELSGFDFANRIRANEATANTPILFCSALSDEEVVVNGLNLGADDYVTKPFNIGEVQARVRAVLRRAARASDSDAEAPAEDREAVINFREIRLDLHSKECFLNGELVTLTRTEFDILLFFLNHPNRIYSREEIIREVWGPEVVVTERTIDTNITRLRKKLGDYERYIVTRQGFGYGLKEKD